MRHILAVLIAAVSAIAIVAGNTPHVAASVYGAGTYGSCQYQECGITLTSSETVTLDVTPVGEGTNCSVASDTLSVTTSSSTGYTVTIATAGTSSEMTSSSAAVIPSTAGSAAAPIPLVANTWGYRVDNLTNFGAGPTLASSSGPIPSQSFASVPSADDTADTVMSSQVAASTADTSKVWYGVCVNSVTPSGSYARDVTYTAVVN